ncbi:DUF1707 SHOCT-like domain-containing protein [Streptomyces sp. NPDC055085]
MTERSRNSEQDMLASDDERDRATERVRDALATGRIDMTQMDQRLTEIYRAKTRAELEVATRRRTG